MSDKLEKHRRWAVQRFINGEKASSICASLGRSASWLYKRVRRYVDGDYCWNARDFMDLQDVSLPFFSTHTRDL